MFLPYVFGEERPKFWDVDFKITTTSHHVAKFHGDRLRELEGLALEKNEIGSKTEWSLGLASSSQGGHVIKSFGSHNSVWWH